MSYLSYPVRRQVIALSTLLAALQCSISVLSWFCDYRACISLGGRIDTDTGCAGCRRVCVFFTLNRSFYPSTFRKNTHRQYIIIVLAVTIICMKCLSVHPRETWASPVVTKSYYVVRQQGVKKKKSCLPPPEM